MPKPLASLLGQRFTRWTVIGGPTFTTDKKRKAIWVCRCDCGIERNVIGNTLREGSSRSCGCWRDEQVAKRRLTHGRSQSVEYTTWQSIKNRCGNPNDCNYWKYGKKGIRVCDRWQDDFSAFFADMGARPSKTHSIDRIDNTGDYEPSNCRWATRTQQSHNRANTVRLSLHDQTLTLAEWATVIGINRRCLRARLERGWSVERILTEPHRPRH